MYTYEELNQMKRPALLAAANDLRKMVERLGPMTEEVEILREVVADIKNDAISGNGTSVARANSPSPVWISTSSVKTTPEMNKFLSKACSVMGEVDPSEIHTGLLARATEESLAIGVGGVCAQVKRLLNKYRLGAKQYRL